MLKFVRFADLPFKMTKIIPGVNEIYPKDIIAFMTLIACFILIGLGINHVVSGIAIMIVTYYFSKRVYEERNPDGNLSSKVQELETKLNEPKVMKAKFNNVEKIISAPKEPLTTGDFKPLSTISPKPYF